MHRPMLRDMLPTTASGRFRFMLVVGVCILAIAVLVLWIVPALAPVHLGGGMAR
jgi:Na+/melibiose symporter-like transporter